MQLSPENIELLTQLQTLHAAGKLEGMYPNIPNEVYHHPDCPGVSKSNLDKAAKSYEHYRLSILKAKEEHAEPDFKDKFFVGTAFHMIVLEPELFDKTFAIAPVMPKYDRRTKTGKEAAEYWERTVMDPWARENAGKIVLPDETVQLLNRMRASVLGHPKLKKIIENSLKEATFFWRDEKTGLTCRCRPDAISMEFGIALDLKSTADGADFISFRRSMVKWNYDKQAAFYLAGIKKVTGRDFQFVFAPCEKEEPNLAAAYRINEAALDVGNQLYRRDLDKISSVHRGEKPAGYSADIEDIDLPAYGFDVESRQ